MVANNYEEPYFQNKIIPQLLFSVSLYYWRFTISKRTWLGVFNVMILRAKKEGNFTTVYNEFIYDKNLSARAKGVLMWILSKPDDWVIYKKNLHYDFKEGREAIWKAFKELIDAKYVIEVEKNNVDPTTGRFTKRNSDYVVYEVSVNSPSFDVIYTNQRTEVQSLDSGFILNTNVVNTNSVNKLNTKKRINTKKDANRFFSFLDNVGLEEATRKTLNGLKEGNSISTSILPKELLSSLVLSGCHITKYGKLIWQEKTA